MRALMAALACVLIVAVISCGHAPWLRLYLSLQGCKYQQVQTANFRISYFDSGETQLPPLVLVHGFMVSSSLNWFNLVHRLKNKYRIIFLDLLYANLNNVLSPAYTLDAEIRLFQEFLQAQNLENPLLVFFSMGCLIAPSFTKDNHVVLIAPPPFHATGFAEDVKRLFLRDSHWFSQSLFKTPPMGYALFATVMHWRFQRHFSYLQQMFHAQQYWAEPFQQYPPKLVLLPDSDMFFPATKNTMKNSYAKNSTSLPHTGHAATWDSPQHIVDCLLALP